MQGKTKVLVTTSAKTGITINIDKTMVMGINNTSGDSIWLEGAELEDDSTSPTLEVSWAKMAEQMQKFKPELGSLDHLLLH